MFENFVCLKPNWPGAPLIVETGKMGQLANGECLVRYGETVVHVAATASGQTSRRGGFLPPFPWILKKNCIRWAVSPVPFLKREGRPHR